MDGLGFWLTNGIVALILISSFSRIIRGNLFDNTHKKPTLMFLFIYITPLLLIALYSIGTEPSYKYEYGKTWWSLLEVGSPKIFIFPLFLIGVIRLLYVFHTNRVLWVDFFIQLTFVLYNFQHVITIPFKHYGPETFIMNNIQPFFYLLCHMAILYRLFNEVKPKYKLSSQLNHISMWLCGLSATYIWKIYEAKRLFNELPAHAPPEGCFIVTAAGKGHQNFVGSFFSPAYNKVMTRQLIIFYQFEFYLMEHFPRFHKGLRKVYNRIGPKIAKRIRTQWIADVVYLLLKPLEYLILLILMLRK